ncbi:MAG: flavodoxin [Brevinema sp.]
MLGILASGTTHAQATRQRILIAYYSRTGNTRTVATEIQRKVGGTLFEIQTVQNYPSEYRATTDIAKEEQRTNARPALSTTVSNINDYDTIFIGFPSWWGTMPMACFTFLEAYNFSGKTIIPFVTHEGSGLGRSEADIKRLAPQASLKQGFAIRGSAASRTDITPWLRGVGLVQ